jgi:hypothetical protein
MPCIMAATSKDSERAIGVAPERLSLEEQIRLAGKLVALEIYTPEALPLRRIEAIGDSLEECIRTLTRRGLNPALFEFVRLPNPF